MELDDLRHARRTRELVVLEGFHAIKHAIRFGGELLGLWTADPEEVERLRRRLAPDLAPLAPTVVDHAALAAIVPRAQVVAVARRPEQPDPDGLLALEGPGPIVVLQAPRHLGNLGACVRVAAGAGAAGVLVVGGEIDPWHPDALRGSAGLHFALPVTRTRELRTGDRTLVALDPDGESLATATVAPRALLAFGTERDGLTDALLDRADQRLALPMRPGVSSLNLATAVSATLFSLALR